MPWRGAWVPVLALIVGCGSKGDTGDSASDATATATGSGTGATSTGTGAGATGTGAGASGTGTGTTGTGTGTTGTGTGMTGTGSGATGTGTGATGTGMTGTGTGATGTGTGMTGTGTGTTGTGTGTTGTGTGTTGTGTGTTGTGTTGTGTGMTGTGTGGTGTGTGYPRPTSLQATCEASANPLRYLCEVTVDPPQPVQVQFSRDDGLGQVRVHTSSVVAATHEVPVYFMAPEKAYRLKASAVHWPGARTVERTVTPDAVPEHYGSWLSVDGTSRVPMVGTHLPCADDAVAVVYDTATGDLLWYEELDPLGRLGLLDMVRFSDDHTVMGETNSTITEVDLRGNVNFQLVKGVDYDANAWLHHDVFRKGDLIYVPYQENLGGLLVNGVVIYDTAGNEVAEWDPRDHLPLEPGATGDWYHMNTVYLDDDDNMYLSFLTQNTVVKVVGDPSAPDFGEKIWVMGQQPMGMGNDLDLDWSQIDGVDGYIRQHNVRATVDGRVSFLDNQHGRGLVVQVDEDRGKAVVTASYATQEPTCGAQGTHTETGAGSQMVACGPNVREYVEGSDTFHWSASPQCADGGVGRIVARWYPLNGW